MDHRTMTHTMDMVATIHNTMDMGMDITARDMAIMMEDIIATAVWRDMVCITVSDIMKDIIMDIRNTAATFYEQELKWPWLYYMTYKKL